MSLKPARIKQILEATIGETIDSSHMSVRDYHRVKKAMERAVTKLRAEMRSPRQ